MRPHNHPWSPPDPLPTDLQELGISLWNGATPLPFPALGTEEASVAPSSVAALRMEQGAAPIFEELPLLTWGSKPQWPADSMLWCGLGYLEHAWRDNTHFTAWSFPPQPQMPETLIKSIKLLPICYWDPTAIRGWTWSQVRAAALQKRGKEWLIGEGTNAQTPWQRELTPTYVVLYVSSEACCHAAYVFCCGAATACLPEC